jgi:hypothetical protein
VTAGILHQREAILDSAATNPGRLCCAQKRGAMVVATRVQTGLSKSEPLWDAAHRIYEHKYEART